jgi:hypothetical protein
VQAAASGVSLNPTTVKSLGIGEPETLGSEVTPVGLAQHAALVVDLELDLGGMGALRVGQDVVVGDQGVGCDQEAAAVLGATQHHKTPYRACRQHAAGKKSDPQDVVATDDPLAQRLQILGGTGSVLNRRAVTEQLLARLESSPALRGFVRQGAPPDYGTLRLHDGRAHTAQSCQHVTRDLRILESGGPWSASH